MALQEDRDIRRITIVGGGTTGYLAAFYLSKYYPDKKITWFFPEVNDPIGVGEALVPASSGFLESVGIPGVVGLRHTDIIKHCNGTLKLGIKFDGFNRPGESFMFPFGFGENDRFNSSSILHIMKSEKIPSNLLDYPDLATHFRTLELFQYLDTVASTVPNLEIVRKAVTATELEGTYDFLIDCTGLNSKLSYIPDNFLDIKDIIPNNAALTIRLPYTDLKAQRKPYSVFKAMEYGWMWHIPLGDQLAMGYVHNNKYDVTDEMIQSIKDKMGIETTSDMFRKVNFKSGRCKAHLTGNVVRLGLASSFIEPLESTGIYLIASGILKVKDYLDGKIDEDEYNRSVNDDFDTIVNFIVAHYKFSKRDNEYWNHFKTLPCERYRPQEIFPTEVWDYILAGFDDSITPPKERLDPKELINISKGIDYQEWLDNARNSK